MNFPGVLLSSDVGWAAFVGFMSWLPQAVLAWAAIVAAYAWRKQLREPARIDIARRALRASSKMVKMISELRAYNGGVRGALADVTSATKTLGASDTVKSAIKSVEKTFSPKPCEPELEEVRLEAEELALELDALGFHKASASLERLAGFVRNFQSITSNLSAPEGYESPKKNPFERPPHDWPKVLYLESKQESEKKDDDWSIAEDDTTQMLEQLKQSLRKDLIPVVKGTKK